MSSLPSDAPAYEQGLNTGDQIVAVDGYRASQVILDNMIRGKKPGDKIRLTVFRFDEMRTIEFTLGGRAPMDYSISPVPSPSDQQRQLYQGWTKKVMQ